MPTRQGRSPVGSAARYGRSVVIALKASLQVTILAPYGLHADALSTAAFILGPERALEMLARVPGNPEAVIIDRDLRIWTTPGTRNRLVMRAALQDGRLPGPTAYGAAR